MHELGGNGKQNNWDEEGRKVQSEATSSQCKDMEESEIKVFQKPGNDPCILFPSSQHLLGHQVQVPHHLSNLPTCLHLLYFPDFLPPLLYQLCDHSHIPANNSPHSLQVKCKFLGRDPSPPARIWALPICHLQLQNMVLNLFFFFRWRGEGPRNAKIPNGQENHLSLFLSSSYSYSGWKMCFKTRLSSYYKMDTVPCRL